MAVTSAGPRDGSVRECRWGPRTNVAGAVMTSAWARTARLGCLNYSRACVDPRGCRTIPAVRAAVRLILLRPPCPARSSAGPRPGRCRRGPARRGQPRRHVEAEREKKQQKLEPPKQNVLERGLKAVERGGVPLITRDGVYAKLGSHHHRQRLRLRRRLSVPPLLRSRRRPRPVGRRDHDPGTGRRRRACRCRSRPDGRIVLNTYGRRHDYPQEDFFGIGPDSARADHTTFRVLATTVGARANGQLVGPLAVGGGVEYLTPSVGDGKDEKVPPIGDVFDDASAPGLRFTARLRPHAGVRGRGLAGAPQRPPRRLVPRRAAATTKIAIRTSTRSTGSTSTCGSSSASCPSGESSSPAPSSPPRTRRATRRCRST